MNLFRTPVNITASENKINYHSRCLFIGSCFTESIGNYLKGLKFQTDINPFGIVYNPVSIKNSIEILLSEKNFTEKDLDLYNDVWFSFHHHSRFSDPDKKGCLDKINDSIKSSTDFIKKTDFLFITFGTSYIYTHKEKKIVVSNCHKLPSDTFIKTLMQPEEIFSDFSELIKKIKKTNSSLKIIFTISPVRHRNDGFIENQHSKSALFVAVHKIIEKNENCFYFPAYEILMDELRDYRFYASDMIHPNDTAIDYIRQKFTETYIDKNSQGIIPEIKKLEQAKNHRTFFAETNANIKFEKDILQKISDLKMKYPFLNLQEYENYFGKDE